MEPPKDSASGRHIIEGRGIPVDGGIYIGADGIRTVVDSDVMKQPKLNAVMKEAGAFLTKNQEAILGVVPAMVREYLPVNPNSYESICKNSGNPDRYQLQVFLKHKDKDERELGGGGPDQQALLAALMLEKHYKNKYKHDFKTRFTGKMPTVAVVKDPKDKHARVLVMTRIGDIYEFDPKGGDNKFKKI